MTAPVAIDIWSDIACPWCYIGKRNLEEALQTISADTDAPQVAVTFHSFELAPDTPTDFDGSEIDFLASHKGMPRAQVEQMLAQVTDVAAKVGLDYRFDQVQHTNTLKAHELLHFAKEQGRQLETAERLMSAYFSEGRHLGKVDELVALAQDAGLDGDDARAALESGRFADAVQQDKARAGSYGIQGVPFFVIDGRYGISGAQPATAFAQVLREIWAERGSAEG